MPNLDALTVFEYARETFHRVSKQTCYVTCFRIAGQTVCLRIADHRLAQILTPAFAHLAPAVEIDADLTICAWDAASAADQMPQPPDRTGSTGIEFIDGELRVAWSIAEQSFSVLSTNSKLAFFRALDASALPAWEQAAPFRRILHWWASKQNLQMVHAAAVGTPDSGLLLVGKGGSGKSTTALACIGSRLGYAGDDYCLLSPGPNPQVHSLYGSGKADSGAAARLPRLHPAFESSRLHEQEKAVIFVHDHVPESILRSFPLRGIVVPRIVEGGTCKIEKIPKSDALRAMAPSTLFQIPGDQAKSLARLASIVRQLPCWSIYLGENPCEAPARLEQLV